MHDPSVFREQGIQGLERYLTTLERFRSAQHLSRSTSETLSAFHREARRIYYILSEWMALSAAEQEAYKARLDCCASYYFSYPPKANI